jgi:hypothetical protein
MRADVSAVNVTFRAASGAPQPSARRHTNRRAARSLAMVRNWSASAASVTAIFGKAAAGAMPPVSAARR